MVIVRCIAIIFTATLLVSCSGQIRTPVQSDNAVIGDGIFGGQLVTASDELSKSIVGIIAVIKDSAGGIRSRELCTGAIISNNVILTAAHCIPTGSEVEIEFGTDIYSKTVIKRNVISRFINLDWLKTEKVGVNDIALLKFEGDLPAGYSIVNYEKIYSTNTPTDVIIAGFGRTSGQKANSQSDPRQGSGLLRKALMQVSEIDLESTSINLLQTYNQGACNGDSGGPAFVKNGEELVLVGIASYTQIKFSAEQTKYISQTNGDMKKFISKYPDFDFCRQDSYYMNVGYFVDWIHFNMLNL